MGNPTSVLGLRSYIRNIRASGLVLAMPALLLLSALFVLPVLILLSRSFLDPQPGLQNYAELLSSSSYRTILFNTFIVSTTVTLVTLAVGFPVAWLLAVVSRFWAMAVFAVILLSMWTNLLTRTFAWMILLQSTGVINRALIALGVIDTPLALTNNLIGVTIGMTYIMFPFIVLPLYATMKAMDPAVLRAASLCGASRLQCFLHVFLPNCASGIVAGCLMVFVMSLGYFVTPVLLGGPSYMMLAELIVQLIQSMLNWGLGAAAAFILFAATLALYALQIRLFDPLTDARKG
ncbi:ABC transporter permease [Hypericibacter terrae]|jgi:putative spermidine/putrescine transport system permease protein|uniref:ABC transporter permease n=1 Tax=Hypericibacter terrae TaxID=2602015 RepID=A0A5J6MIK8_9PROT|nr:ABC transporter permease [Hypericibacter terrae]QEX17284.1 ABC transporter permease [Hypericibacter terrae]